MQPFRRQLADQSQDQLHGAQSCEFFVAGKTIGLDLRVSKSSPKTTLYQF